MPQSASENEIRKAYRKLSLQHHPDKGGNEELFQKIAKAYETLSNPDVRANWEKYGNPDGKGAMEVSIGLPPALVGPIGRYFFVGGYLFLLVAVLPFMMFKRWASTPPSTKLAGLEKQSLALINLYSAIPSGPNAPPKPIALVQTIDVLSALVEGAYSQPLSEMDTIEIQRLMGLLVKMELPKGAKKPDVQSLEVFPVNLTIPLPQQLSNLSQQIIRNRVLLYAYLYRVPIESAYLREHVKKILDIMPIAASAGSAIAFDRTRQDLARYKEHRAKNIKPLQRNIDFLPGAQAWREIKARLAHGIGFKDVNPKVLISGELGSVTTSNPAQASLYQVFTPQQWEKAIELDNEVGVKNPEKRYLRGIRNLYAFTALPKAVRDEVLLRFGDKEGRRLIRLVDSIPVLEVRGRLGIAGISDDAELMEKRGRNPKAPLGSEEEGPGEWGGEEGGSKMLLCGDIEHIYLGDIVSLNLRVRYKNLEGTQWSVDDKSAPAVPKAFVPLLPKILDDGWYFSVTVEPPRGGGDVILMHEEIVPKTGLITIPIKFQAFLAGLNRFKIKFASTTYLGLEYEHRIECNVLHPEDNIAAKEEEEQEGEQEGEEQVGGMFEGMFDQLESMESRMRAPAFEDESDVSDVEPDISEDEDDAPPKSSGKSTLRKRK